MRLPASGRELCQKGGGAGNPLLPEEKRLRGPDASFPALGKSLTKSAKISEKQR